jgi:hypothetical protein
MAQHFLLSRAAKTLTLAQVLREAMAEEMKGRVVGGEDKVAEIDAAYFGGYIKPTNRVEDRLDRRLAQNQNGKRKAVVVARERGGRPAIGTCLLRDTK